MTTFQVGQTVTVAIKVYDSVGALANVGAMTCTAVKPDGTTAAATVTNPSTGNYQAALAAPIAGRYVFPFTATGVNSGGTPWTDVADVWPLDPRMIISLADAKAELNMPETHVVNDDELRLYIAATTPVVEQIVGRVLTATLVETFDGGMGSVALSERAAAITSVTVNGAAYTDYVADLAAGVVYAGSMSSAELFSWGVQNVVVTYTVGSASIDPNVILGARIIVAHQYQVGQQSKAGRGRSPGQDTVVTASGFAIPSRALEVLSPNQSRKMPGFA